MSAPRARVTWVRSQRTPDGDGYRIVLDVGPDVTWSLTPQAAVDYAVALHHVATVAEHEAALVGTLRDRGMPDELLAQIVGDIRGARPDRDPTTAPLQFRPGVSAATGEPFVHVHAQDGDRWQWSPSDVRHHAGSVLSVVTATEEDNRLLAVLTGAGVPEGSATQLIHAMGERWPAEEEPNVVEPGED